MEDYTDRAEELGLTIPPGKALFGPLTGENEEHFMGRFPILKDAIEAFGMRLEPINLLLEQLPDHLEEAEALSSEVSVHPARRVEDEKTGEIIVVDEYLPLPARPGNSPFNIKLDSVPDSLDASVDLALLWIHRDEILGKAEQKFNQDLANYQKSLGYLFSSITGSDWGIDRKSLPTISWTEDDPMSARDFNKLFNSVRERLNSKGRTGSTSKAKIGENLRKVEGNYRSLYKSLRAGQSARRLFSAISDSESINGSLAKRVATMKSKPWVERIVSQTQRPSTEPGDFSEFHDPLQVEVEEYEAWESERLRFEKTCTRLREKCEEQESTHKELMDATIEFSRNTAEFYNSIDPQSPELEEATVDIARKAQKLLLGMSNTDRRAGRELLLSLRNLQVVERQLTAHLALSPTGPIAVLTHHSLAQKIQDLEEALTVDSTNVRPAPETSEVTHEVAMIENDVQVIIKPIPERPATSDEVAIQRGTKWLQEQLISIQVIEDLSPTQPNIPRNIVFQLYRKLFIPPIKTGLELTLKLLNWTSSRIRNRRDDDYFREKTKHLE
jgi:hypothetical protein